MTDTNRSDTKGIPKVRNVTGSYPGVTGTYKPHSAYPEGTMPTGSVHGSAESRSEKIRNSANESKPHKKGFDFRLLFSGDNNREFLRQLRYYGLIVLASLLLTFGIVSLSNDVFAFVKRDESIIVTVEQGVSTKKIASALKKAKVIDHPLVFRLYCKLKKADGKFQYGDYSLNSNLAYDQIISALKKPSVQAESFTVNIEPGSTQDEIVSYLTSNKYASAEELENALNKYDYDKFEFVKDLPDRRCRLEGYLPSGEYEFFVGESAVSMISKMLTRFEETVLTDENKELIKASGKTTDEIITLASLVQAECDNANDYAHAASVLQNRLASGTGFLQLTSPINYVLSAKKTQLTADDRQTDSDYNTYIYAGLPKGPVCNPTAEAVRAVLSPSGSDDMYFISDGENTYFAKDKESHMKNLKGLPATVKGTDTVR